MSEIIEPGSAEQYANTGTASDPGRDTRSGADAGNLPVYVVTLDTPRGVAELDVPTFQGPGAAGRRGHLAAVQLGWGDLDEVTVTDVRLLGETDAPIPHS